METAGSGVYPAITRFEDGAQIFDLPLVIEVLCKQPPAPGYRFTYQGRRFTLVRQEPSGGWVAAPERQAG